MVANCQTCSEKSSQLSSGSFGSHRITCQMSSKIAFKYNIFILFLFFFLWLGIGPDKTYSAFKLNQILFILLSLNYQNRILEMRRRHLQGPEVYLLASVHGAETAALCASTRSNKHVSLSLYEQTPQSARVSCSTVCVCVCVCACAHKWDSLNH